MIGNDFVVPSQPRLVPAAASPTVEPIALPAPAVVKKLDFTPPASLATETSYVHQTRVTRGFETFLDIVHHYSLGVFALLFLLIGATGIQVGNAYWSAHVASHEKLVAAAIKPAVRTIAGLNITVKSDQLSARLQTITGQTAVITVGDQSVPISPDTIKSWLQITASKDKTEDYVRIKADAMSASLTDIANKYVKAPVDQVTSTSSGTAQVIVAGHDGVKLTDPAGLKTQADAVAKTVMDGKGLQFNTPLAPQAFALLTPANFTKLIEANVVTKQMYLYENGNLYKSYPVSAGAPATPTPLGEYKIFSKLPVQTMTGFNADGSKYTQPNVRWINYFLPGGYAVHGNYWRPQSWFGNINSSHGCVSLPDDQAKEVYDWAPMGTTVITHA